MSEKVWFTSDTHFNHGNLAEWRGFGSVGDMNQALIRNWNTLVGEHDRVYHCGDFAWGAHGVEDLVKILNGHIHLIIGNHDGDGQKIKESHRSLFTTVSQHKYIEIEGQKIFLCHYACLVWRSSHHGSWHLYGHSHGSLADSDMRLSMDIGVDTNDLKPYSFEQIKEKMSKKAWQPADYHGRFD